MMQAPHIVVVDDEEDLREPTAAYLRDQGLDVSEAGGGVELDTVLAGKPAQLVVLDVTMPVEDGFSGADDYMMKPYEPRELLARVRSVLRRMEAAPAIAAAPPAAEPVSDDGDYHREIWVPTGRGQIRLPVEAIEWIEAAKDYALLHTAERSHMIRVTMGALEQRRSSFVRLDAVGGTSQIGRHTTLVLKSGASVRVGPAHLAEVRHRLGR
jgi:CheY-like chemotaxis protein